MSFNWVDFVLLLIVAGSAYAGWQRGFILSAIDLVRWVGSWLAALVLYKPAAHFLGLVIDISDIWRIPLAFVGVLVIVSFAITALAAKLLGGVGREAHHSKTNRAFGLLPGALSGLILAAILSALLFAMPFADGISRAAQESRLANDLAVYTEDLESALVPVFDPALRETLSRLRTVEPGSTESYELPYKVEAATPAPDLEARMLELVNRERAANGLRPVEADPEMREVARKHSADMFARGYFSHYTPDGKSPFDRMREDGVRFRTAGENLALAPTLEIAHNGLMNSPGHRENILRPQFGRLGIGILDGGRAGLMVTQKFRD